jgi:hypothetical protein
VIIEFKTLADAQTFRNCADHSLRMGHGSMRNASLVVSLGKAVDIRIK